MVDFFIKNFKQLASLGAEISGGKGKALGEMIQAGIPVPPGFVILATAFDEFLKETDLNVEIEAILKKVDLKKIHTIENASRKIQARILSKEIPLNIQKEILGNYRKLNTELVAVRSSATLEDSSSAAWAGQLESYLNTPETTLLEKVKKCWASLFTPRAIFYRFERKLNQKKVSVAVVIQKMVASEKSGIAFSVHPVTEDENQIIIEAGFGLGEAIVSGSITPDSYVLGKKELQIIDINVNEQKKALCAKSQGGNVWKELKEKGKEQVLTQKEIIELAQLIIKIENYFGFPCDIEWAKEKEHFFIVQSRPITTLKKKEIPSEKEKFIIPRIREEMLSPAYWNAVLQTSRLAENNYRKTLSIEYLFFVNGQMRAVIPKKNWDEVGEYIAEKLIKEAGYFENLRKKTIRAKRKILFFLKEMKKGNLSNSSFLDLINFSNKIYHLFLEYDAASVFAWFIAGDPLKEKIKMFFKIENEDLSIITLPLEKTYSAHLEREIMKEALGRKPLREIALILREKYYWMPFGYDGPVSWDERYFEARIKESRFKIKKTKLRYEKALKIDKELKQKSREILKKINPDKTGKRLINILQSITLWTDERKMLDFQLFFWYHQILLEFERRYNFPIIDLKYLFIEELKELAKDQQLLKDSAEKRRKQEFMIVSAGGKIRIATKKETQRIKKIIKQQLQKNNIRGSVACRGPKAKYSAPIKTLSSSEECFKIKKGEILVATMTTPDYLPAMNRALGFITDEGGVTCHAAIIAREMNKPCIIGTKNATQILKDGDLVEVDANQGIVKILKRASKK